jgi:hypothetical protein
MTFGVFRVQNWNAPVPEICKQDEYADSRHSCRDTVQAIDNFVNSAFVTDGLFVKRRNNHDIHHLINPQINNTDVETILYPVNFYDCLRDI